MEEEALPAPGAKSNVQLNYMGPSEEQLLQETVEKERNIETDNPENLTNMRGYDDWKDGTVDSCIPCSCKTKISKETQDK